MCDILLISQRQQKGRYAVPLRTVTNATGYNRYYCLEMTGEFPFSDFPKRQRPWLKGLVFLGERSRARREKI